MLTASCGCPIVMFAEVGAPFVAPCVDVIALIGIVLTYVFAMVPVTLTVAEHVPFTAIDAPVTLSVVPPAVAVATPAVLPALHVIAAFKHHIWNKNDVLVRVLPDLRSEHKL